MEYRLVIAPKAEEDLQNIAEYIARDNPQAACRFSKALLSRTNILIANPHIGVALKRRKGVRYIVHYPYLIFYRVNNPIKTIEVLHFWHGSRNRKTIDL